MPKVLIQLLINLLGIKTANVINEQTVNVD